MTDERLWYKDAVIYELRVRSFYDSDGDGIGDFKGLTQKLDYLQDLGVTVLWLLPFYPSPLRDDGYDTADYTTVHPQVGTLADFKVFLKEAHRRGLKVVTELVLNHTSDQHPWFQRARRAPRDSRWRNFYVWADTPERYGDARIIFQDFETSNWSWDPIAKQYFWHRFYSHQPDLNYRNPDVQKALFDVVDHWFELGVDGLRLDAVPYLFEEEGTNCENLPETHALLRKLRAHVDRRFKNRMLLAEANQWPEDAVSYFGNGDECHMAFHFPIMPRLFMGLRMEDNFPILDILEQTPQIPETCQWAIFLRNHDELTLEMVTDEERDYMVGAYAADRRARINLGIRRRLAPLLENNRRRIELMDALLFSLPGTPVVYYGDEIGMGDNVYLGDRDGVRTPMQWSPDRNAGFSRTNPQQLILPLIVDPEYHYEAINVETQQRNPSSLLWWTKRLIWLRKEHLAFSRGTLEPLTSSNRKVLAFLRRHHDEALLIVANLSRFCQYAELDLGEFRGHIPLELFGHSEFPRIGDSPYLLTLGPHSFFWFSLAEYRGRLGEVVAAAGDVRPVTVEAPQGLEELLETRSELEQVLAKYVPRQRWFRSKTRKIKSLSIYDNVAAGSRQSQLVFIEVKFAEGDPELYVMPLVFVPGDEVPEHALALVRNQTLRGNGTIVDGFADPSIAGTLLELCVKKKRLKGKHVEIVGLPTAALRPLRETKIVTQARPLGVEQTNTTYVYADRLVGKLLRRVEEGESVELEVLRQLALRGFSHAPELLGQLDVRYGRTALATLAIFQGYVPNQGDAWRYTLDEVGRFFERVLTEQFAEKKPAPVPSSTLERAQKEPSFEMAELIGNYLQVARLLGQRTAELHRALSTQDEAGRFARERIGPLSKRSFYQSLRNLASRALDQLKDRLPSLSHDAAELARQLLRRERDVRQRLKRVLESPLAGWRIRVHGDYHLGQVLYTGKDFVIIDFEGEPARSLADRRRLRSPMADVAGMIRSFHYALYGSLTEQLGASVRREDVPLLREWAPTWYGWVSGAFVGAYLAEPAMTELLPESAEDRALLLDVHLFEKAVYELSYELNNRPGWAEIPLVGILELLDAGQKVS